MFRKVATYVLVLMMGVVFASAPMASQGGKPAEKQVLRIGIARADLRTLDPHRGTGGQDRNVADMVFNGLVRFEPGNVKVFEPDLAQSVPKPKRVNGKQVWTFHLRKGVRVHPFPGFPNGYELTAEDVVFSLTKAANPKLSAFAGSYPDGMSVRAADRYTVEISLDQPLSSTLFLPKVSDLEGGFIIPKKAFEKLGPEAFSTHPVGTGPFMFEKYEPGVEVILKRNENYFRGKPVLKRIEFKYMSDESSRELALKTGELDIAELARVQDAIERVQGYGIPVKTWSPGSAVNLYLNLSVEPLNLLKVRKAILYALDRNDNSRYYGDVTDPIYSQVPPVMRGGLTKGEVEEVKGIDYVTEVNLEKAKELLAEAGYPNGFSLEVVTTPHQNYKPNYTIAKAQLKKIGIDIKIKMVDHATYHSMIRKDVNPIVVYSAPRPNADVYLTQFWHSKSIVVTGDSPVTNFSHYKKVDDLIEQAKTATNPDKQVDLWKKAQIQTLKDAVTYPLVVIKYVFAVQSYVDLGYEFKSTFAEYPQITEDTRILKE